LWNGRWIKKKKKTLNTTLEEKGEKKKIELHRQDIVGERETYEVRKRIWGACREGDLKDEGGGDAKRPKLKEKHASQWLGRDYP